MTNRLYEARQKYPDFDKKLVDMFSKQMKDLLDVIIEGMDFDNHIGTKEIAIMAEPYITNNKGEHIGFKWDYETLISASKSYIDFEEADFYETDLWVWANVKYGDMQHITTDASTIIKYAIAELMDEDFPFYPASQRAYCWLKKHIEHEEQ